MNATPERFIQLIIKPDGHTVVETKGFSGATCRDASRFIEQALGQRQSEQLTAEFHQTASQVNHHQRQE